MVLERFPHVVSTVNLSPTSQAKRTNLETGLAVVKISHHAQFNDLLCLSHVLTGRRRENKPRRHSWRGLLQSQRPII